MARYFARIVRAVIVSSLGFGGGIGLLTFIVILVTTGKQPTHLALQAAMVIGLGFGVLCAFVLLLSDLTSRLFAAHGLKNEIWELNQERSIIVNGTLKHVRALNRDALLAVPNIKAVADDENEYIIRASVGPTWKSAGEKMEITIEALDDESRWKATCVSACLQPHIAFEYGKNFENVEAWLRRMLALTNTSAGEKSEH